MGSSSDPSPVTQMKRPVLPFSAVPPLKPDLLPKCDLLAIPLIAPFAFHWAIK